MDKIIEDYYSKYDLEINDLLMFKMRKEFKNLKKREIFGLSELEVYIIRCIGNVYPHIANNFDDVGYILNIDSSRVKIIYINILSKIYNYIRREYYLLKYGQDSIFNIDGVDLDLLLYLYRNNIKKNLDLKDNNLYKIIFAYYNISNDLYNNIISLRVYNKLIKRRG